MLKIHYSFIIVVVLIIIISVIFTVYGDRDDIKTVCRFLESYGWEVDNAPIDTADVIIPKEFDEVYKNYNVIQKKSKLDLSPYKGMNGTRYTFIVKNYPIDVGETVYANVIVVNSQPVAGDIMTVSLDGFMHGLGENGA